MFIATKYPDAFLPEFEIQLLFFRTAMGSELKKYISQASCRHTCTKFFSVLLYHRHTRISVGLLLLLFSHYLLQWHLLTDIFQN